MPDQFTCDHCMERVVPDFQVIDAGGCHPLSVATTIKECPDCGTVLAGP